MTLRAIGIAALLLVASAAHGAPNYNLDWYVANGGGDHALVSANYRMGVSAAQPVAGEASSAAYRLKLGFWYGAHLCACPAQSDLDENGFVDAVDLAVVIDIVFFGAADIQDPSCPATRADFNNDGFADSVDLALLIDHVFFGGAGPDNPCQPS